MKAGGNQQCNAYLQKHGIGPRTPIKQKYESSAAQLYKEVLKARVEGRPEPTELPKPMTTPRSAPPSVGYHGGAASAASNADANGMERLPGETEQQYVARQTRLRDEAKARMAAKFGSSGLGGVGSSRMQGIGSDPNYNRNGGGNGSSGGDLDVSSLVSTFGSVLGSAVNTAKSLADERTVNSIKSTGASFWGGLTSSLSEVASSITAPDPGADGLAELQRQIASQKPNNSKYSGFGSDNTIPNTQFQRPNAFTNSSSRNSSTSSINSASNMNMMSSNNNSNNDMQEAPGLPGEDRNGVERLTGESDTQYVMRQTRLRDEARARMAAKFGGGGLTSASSSSTPMKNTSSIVTASPASGNYMDSMNRLSTSTNPGSSSVSAPSSGNRPRLNPGSYTTTKSTPPPKASMNTTDFFSSFGT